MIMTVQNTIQDGYDYALGFVAEYGPVSILQMRRHLQFQTTLSATEIDSAILQVIAYQSLVGNEAQLNNVRG